MSGQISEKDINEIATAAKIAARVSGAALAERLGRDLPPDKELVELIFKEIGSAFTEDGMKEFHTRRILRGWEQPPQETTTTSPTRG